MRVATTFEGELLALIDASLVHAGYYVVKLQLADGQRKGSAKRLQLIAERLDGEPMGVADCEAITHTASALLDVSDPIESKYDLEVSSAGMERPLTSLADFKRFEGREASVSLNLAQEGRKRFKGKIGAIEGERVMMISGEEQFGLAFSNMRSAHLVVTDEMIKELMKDTA